MSKKNPIPDPFQPKITRNDRFAQMSHQEKVIEQKKREIQAKLEAKLKHTENIPKSASPTPPKQIKTSFSKKLDIAKKSGFNLFSNDGSFLDTFKQLKEKKVDVKRSFKSKEYSDQRLGSKKSTRWSQRRRSPSPKDRTLKPRISRFNDKATFEPKITINTSFNNIASFDPAQIAISPQNMTGQPLLKNIISTPVVFPTSQNTTPVIAAPPLLLNVPPPQIVQNAVGSTVLLPNSSGNMLLSAPTVNVTIPATGVLTTVTIPPPPQSVNTLAIQPSCVANVELSSIPPPNPIQVQNIPQPEPLNALNIPHPAPIQVQNIPTPAAIQLNEIPNPKPLDLLAIPTPNEAKSISDPDFIKNIPPPNKSIPPPSLPETNINIPPPNTALLPPPNIIPVSIPPPQAITASITQNLAVQAIAPCQNILVHTIPPPQGAGAQIQTIQSIQSNQAIQNITAGVPPPSLQPEGTFASISVSLPLAVVPPNSVTVNNIPSLMAQPILPPPGMGVTTVNVSCPPPILPAMQAPPPFVNQPPPMTNQMPPMNVPPPSAALGIINTGPIAPPFRDLNAGTSDYEAMASLGRMVAQCGEGIEEVVKQRKTQDPNLWFLFHKEAAAYQQYRQLVEQFKEELNGLDKGNHYKPEDIYEPEMAMDDDEHTRDEFHLFKDGDSEHCNRRKRKSRWGEKDISVPPPTLIMNNPPLVQSILSLPPVDSGNVMISKITRNDSGLIQYALSNYGSTNLTEEDWRKVEDNYKVSILYQDMMKKRLELEKMQTFGKNKYDYDSDEDIDGGTWEHKLRDKEMMATQLWAKELTRQAEGKHHIGDFLPPEEFKKMMDGGGKTPAELSDYKDFTITEDNIGYKMLQKLGWSQGQGLGSNGAGIIEPVNKAPSREQNQGLGLDDMEGKEDEYDAYRKRMMLAYRFRPNPLNNPRRPYY